MKRMRTRIDSDVENLERVHQETGWTPGRAHIRPTPEGVERKVSFLEVLLREYEDESDFILSDVFGVATEAGESGRKRADRAVLVGSNAKHLVPNHFPYATPPGTHHFVLWYAVGREHLTDLQINKDVIALLKQRLSHDRFDVVWYENPKMTVPSIFHVQVFWREEPLA
eukprot:TRINITY_DN4026_c0_g1_i1.p1 TRINITY_DN4026_c0_g1~~TRINITY_DN4026_c0_g1_i1.p1  ORF type:complete len:169 (-),score=51.18 TRINITY_DN4026_c0_g1_i1:311-817(-)